VSRKRRESRSCNDSTGGSCSGAVASRLVFATSGEARAFVIFDPLKSFISNLETGRAGGNGTERGQVKRGAGESGSGQVSQYES